MVSPSSSLTRRGLLRAGVLSYGGFLVAQLPSPQARAAMARAPVSPLVFASPRIEPFVDELPRLPTAPAGGRLVAAGAAHRFHRDLPPSPTWGYGGCSYLGPVLEAHQGAPVDLLVDNRLGAHPLARHLDLTLEGATADDIARPRTVTHLHGGLTEPASDGHPLQGARPLTARAHHFGARQQAATLWYHDHAMGITRLGVYAGLAGVYLQRDAFDTGAADNPLGLPAGEFELPLVIQDKIFTADGALGYRLARYVAEGSWEGGQAGDVGVVNGVAWPTTTVARGLYRLRLVNGSNARSYKLRLSGGLPWHVIGNDQGLLDAPVRCEQVTLAAGERLDVLVDFSGLAPGDQVVLENTERLAAQFLVTGADVRVRQLVRFVVGASRGWRGAIPSTLRGGPRQPPRLPRWPAPTRRRAMHVLQLWDGSRFPPAMMSLNNLPFASRDTEVMVAGTVELWEVANFTTDEHPIHVHLATLRVHSRQRFAAAACGAQYRLPAYGRRYRPPIGRFAYGRSAGPRPWEVGDKDTVFAPPGTITRILVRWPSLEECGFDPDATFTVPARVEDGAPGMTLAAERMPMSMHAVDTGPLTEAQHTGAGDAAGTVVPGAGRVGGAVLGHLGHVLRPELAPGDEAAMRAARHRAVARPDGTAVAVCQLGPQVQPAPGQARGYVWHCHVLDHEDHDMMQAFRVVA